MIPIDTPDGTAEALVARPATGDGPFPGVLFFMDVFGIRPAIEQMAQRIADWGYVVLVPNVFHREGTIEQLRPTDDLTSDEGRAAGFRTASPRIGRLTPELSNSDTRAYIAALQGLEGVRPGLIGVTGYCMGARLATRAAGLAPQAVAAVGGFHGGGLATDAPDSPHLSISRSRARYCYLHADNDPSMPREAIAVLQAALDDAAVEVDHNGTFPGAPHGYTMADTSSYQAAASEKHFELLQALLAASLGSD